MAIQEELQQLKTDLDRKEYSLQQSELKVYHYEKYLQRKGLLDSEARHLLNKFQFDEPIQDQKVSNVVSDNLALKEQLRETIRDVNRLEKSNLKARSIITDLKTKIEKMKKRHAQALKEVKGSAAVAIVNEDSKVIMRSHIGGKPVDNDADDDPSFCYNI